MKMQAVRACKVLKKRNGFGRDEILGTTAVLIIAAFVTFPYLRTFATTITTALTTWWGTIDQIIFP